MAKKAEEGEDGVVAPASGEVQAEVTQNVPQMVVEVEPGCHVVHGGLSYYGAGYEPREDDNGSELTLDGPSAIQLVMSGQVRIVRSV